MFDRLMIFCEILLAHFDRDDAQTTINNQRESVLFQSNLIHQRKSSKDKNLHTMMTFDNTNFSEKPLKHHSTELNGSGPTNLTSETLVTPSTLIYSNPNNTSNFVDTTNVLRKILLRAIQK
jgi:hypothetical protein